MCNCHSNFDKFKIYLLFHVFSFQISYENKHRYFEIWHNSDNKADWMGMITQSIEYTVNHVVYYEFRFAQPNDKFNSYLVNLKHAFRF